jgi:serine/threonine protein kinase
MRKQQHFMDEITINREVVRRYGSHAAAYLTVAPIKGFRSLNLMGAVLTRGTMHTYMIFGHKCNNHYDMHVNMLLSNVVDSLCVLHKAKFLHNDIKLDNIVLCDSRYKLIDWGRAGTIDNLIQGTLTTTNPVKWLLMGVPAKACVPALKLRTRMLHPSYSYSSLFERVYSRIQDEFNIVTAKPFSYERLSHTYVPCFDVFMTGMMLLHAIHVYKLDEATYLPIVHTFISLIHPLNPLQAKKYLAAHI